MGGLLGKNKDPSKKSSFLSGFSGRSKKKESIKQPPVPIKDNEWTDVHLQVPEFVLDTDSQIIENPPIRPPRKYRNKTLTLERQEAKHVGSSEATVEKNKDKTDGSDPYANMIPVEEPIIIPKIEPIHICDGKHHTCVNHFGHICNGAAVTEEQTPPKRAKKVQKEESRPKNKSTVSLPNSDELKQPAPEGEVKETVVNMVNSSASLPPNKAEDISDVTISRIESYMARCKSFSDLPNLKILNDIKDEDLMSDSEESWDDIIEQSIPIKPPVEPKFRLDSDGCTVQEKSPTIAAIKNTERRESIDDFFDSQAVIHHPKLAEIANSVSLGRRGSDGFFGDETYTPPTPNKLDSIIFHTKTFLENERYSFDEPKPKPTKEKFTKIATELDDLQPPTNKESAETNESTTVQHSNLLKIIQENSLRFIDSEDEAKAESVH